jgi:4-carboxymuconolactone decarboxylase
LDAAYEIYAHIAVAEREGMKPERLAALVGDLKRWAPKAKTQ